MIAKNENLDLKFEETPIDNASDNNDVDEKEEEKKQHSNQKSPILSPGSQSKL